MFFSQDFLTAANARRSWFCYNPWSDPGEACIVLLQFFKKYPFLLTPQMRENSPASSPTNTSTALFGLKPRSGKWKPQCSCPRETTPEFLFSFLRAFVIMGAALSALVRLNPGIRTLLQLGEATFSSSVVSVSLHKNWALTVSKMNCRRQLRIERRPVCVAMTMASLFAERWKFRT